MGSMVVVVVMEQILETSETTMFYTEWDRKPLDDFRKRNSTRWLHFQRMILDFALIEDCKGTRMSARTPTSMINRGDKGSQLEPGW